MEIRIAIIPPAKVSRVSGSLGKKYGKQYPSRFLVDNKRLFPHITLFKVEIEKSKYKELVNSMREQLRSVKAFPIQLHGLKSYTGGWVSLGIKSQALTKFRNQLVSFAVTSGFAKKSKIKKNYSPHITLTRFYSDRNAEKIVGEEKTRSEKMLVKTVGLCLSRQTQVHKVLNTINLK